MFLFGSASDPGRSLIPCRLSDWMDEALRRREPDAAASAGDALSFLQVWPRVSPERQSEVPARAIARTRVRSATPVTSAATDGISLRWKPISCSVRSSSGDYPAARSLFERAVIFRSRNNPSEAKERQICQKYYRPFSRKSLSGAALRATTGRSVNPQVPGSSPGRGANIQWVRLVRAHGFGNILGNISCRAFAKSALFRKINGRERRTLDPQVVRTFPSRS